MATRKNLTPGPSPSRNLTPGPSPSRERGGRGFFRRLLGSWAPSPLSREGEGAGGEVILRRLARFALAALTLALPVSAPLPAQAHGDEDHGAAAPSPAPGASELVAAGETRAFSVVLKAPALAAKPAAPGGPGASGESAQLPLRIYVARTDTSEPVPGAKVRVELRGGVSLDLDAEPGEMPGAYRASMPAPPDGTRASATVSVEAPGAFDLVPLGPLRFGPPEVPAPEAPHAEAPAWALGLGVAGALLAGAGAGFALGRRSARAGRAGAKSKGTVAERPETEVSP